jgi:hypothetical protein
MGTTVSAFEKQIENYSLNDKFYGFVNVNIYN